jgi:hypothetical protein
MNKKWMVANNKVFFRILAFVASFSLLAGFIGCGGRYGSITRDPEIKQAFVSNQVSPEYKYYYNGHSFTYAMLGIDPNFRIESKFWREVGPDTEQFKQLTKWLWEDYHYYAYGAHILDPTGKRIGIWYSSIREVTFKFVGDNEIVVIIHTPFLWGPDDGHGGARFGR